MSSPIATAPDARILVQLRGGLGNQMFQAAAGLALAERLGATLAFDLSRYRGKGPRAFALEGLPLEAAIFPGGRPRLGARAGVALARLAGRKTVKAPRGWSGRIYREKAFHYDPAFEAIAGSCLLAGFFQSPLYFAGREEKVRRALDPAARVPEASPVRAVPVEGEDSVAVHLRRGDYAGDEAAKAVHGVLDDAYYERALALLRRIVPRPRLFLFSDDAATAQRKAAEWGGTAADGGSAHADLWLMSRCRHHVIANSSLSWWGAFLDARPGGVTIAPRQWFTRETMLTTYTGDLFPPGWILL